MAPQRLRASSQKKRLEKSHNPVDLKSTKSKKIPSPQNLDLDSFFSRNKRERIKKKKRTLSHVTKSFKQKTFFTCHPRFKSYDFFYKSTNKTPSRRDVSKIQEGHHNWLCKNIQETTSSWKLFRKIIWNRRIITLVVWVIKLHEKIQDKKKSCLILRFSRK